MHEQPGTRSEGLSTCHVPAASPRPFGARARPRVLLTGAAGSVGSALWPRLAGEFDLVLLDRRPVTGAPDTVEVVTADVTDPGAIARAVDRVDAVVHLSGNPNSGASWTELVDPNIDATISVFEATVAAGVGKVVFASSCHASGGYDAQWRDLVDPRWVARPCCRYGVSKVFGENAGRFFADAAGLQVINLRLGAVWDRPYGLIGRYFWLSHDDLARAVTAGLRADIDYGTYFASSANIQGRWNLDPGRDEIGFDPQDDAEQYPDALAAEGAVPDCYRAAIDPAAASTFRSTGPKRRPISS